MTKDTGENAARASRLRRALENEEFVLYYQAKIDTVTRTITGAEALIRWKDPLAGLVPPLSFVPLLESTGIIVDVGAWAIRSALEDQAFWAEMGVAPPRVALNISAVQLRQRNFVDTVRAAIAGCAGGSTLDFDMTESVIMGDVEANVAKLRALHSLSVNIAIDDFGTGFPSRGYLARLPAQTLKIDVSFTGRMLNDAGIMTVVAATISLAHSIGLTVVAEGVETEAQVSALQRLGCDEIQGFLISRPLPRYEMAELLLSMSPGTWTKPSAGVLGATIDFAGILTPNTP
jgi:EAL domain-containing protein (putative c-di-GMP-specific phosphodiesterase class I)